MVRVQEVRVPPRGVVALRFGDLSQVSREIPTTRRIRIGRLLSRQLITDGH